MELLHTAYVPAGEGPFPTILALHGWGASAGDLLGLAPHLLGGRALCLCPQGPVEMQLGPSLQGYGWFPLAMGRPIDPAGFRAGGLRLRRFVAEALAHYPVDASRVVLLGFSQGGAMACDLALEAPERWAALVMLSSWLPEELAARAQPSPALAALPTLVIHGKQDPMIPVARARESRERLEALGMHVSHAEYDMGHAIGPESLRDLAGWLEQVASKKAGVVALRPAGV